MLAHLKSISCRMLAAMTRRGFLPLFMEKMVRLEESRSVVFSVSAAVPAPQQLHQERTCPGIRKITQLHIVIHNYII